MVREGLVRCWNCGGFLRPDVEAQYQKIQRRPQQVIYSPPTGDEGAPDLDAMLAGQTAGSPSELDDEESDFELAGGGTAAPAQKTPSEATPAATPDETTEQPAAEAAAEQADDLPHSVATGGDALMQLAAQEEMERLKRQVARGATVEGVKQIRDGFLIDAPKGCRIQIRDESTGELQRLTFTSHSRVRVSLLDKLAAIQKAAEQKAAKEPAGPKHLSAGKYKRWMSDAHLHTLDPEKLKLKAGSMEDEFVPVELGFSDEHMLVASLAAKSKKGGFFGGGKGGDDPGERRQALLEHFRAGKSLTDAPGGEKKTYPADKLAELRVVQPAASRSESLFAGIPVFGTGRIAVQLPVPDDSETLQFLSFTLSQFRAFVDILGSLYTLGEFGHNLGIPLVDSFTEHKCHYSDVKIRALEYLPYYQADPDIDVVIAGWLCSSCGLAISEDAREREKLGGKGGKGIAKAKCPKCNEKFGHNPLYTLASAVQSPSMSGEEEPADEESNSDAEPSV